jgi:hypothetical protein
MGKAPSAVHDLAGYNSYQGFLTVLGILLLIGIVMAVVKACH